MAQRGKPKPHSPEHEARRIMAIRQWAKAYTWPSGYKRPKEHTAPMLDALNHARLVDPDRYRDLSIANLPKIVSGKKNGNWKGGKTKSLKTFARKNVVRLRKWRENLIKRDGRECKQCGAKEGLLDAHHIIPLAESRAFAFSQANGVILCRRCHAKTESYANSKQERFRPSQWGFIWKIIPHSWQDYPTVGNYIQESNHVAFFTSELPKPEYGWLVFIHEFIEWGICRLTGVKVKDVDRFDKAYEAVRDSGIAPCGCTIQEEPGDDIHAPYREAHQVATQCEMLIAKAVGIDWIDYQEAILKL